MINIASTDHGEIIIRPVSTIPTDNLKIRILDNGHTFLYWKQSGEEKYLNLTQDSCGRLIANGMVIFK